MTEWCFILCTLNCLILTQRYGCAGQFAPEMYFHCHVINRNVLYELLVDGRHLVVAKGYSGDVYSKPSCSALISTMYYFAISQHRHIQIPARNWKQHHPPPIPPPKPERYNPSLTRSLCIPHNTMAGSIEQWFGGCRVGLHYKSQPLPTGLRSS